MNLYRKLLRGFLSGVLVLVILLYFFNATVNQHSHVLDKGIIITHAHPYSKTNDENVPLKSHTHTDNQYILLSQISIPVLTLLLFFFLFFAGILRINHFNPFCTDPVVKERISFRYLRAPPYSFSSNY